MNKKIILGTILGLALLSSSVQALDLGKLGMFGVGVFSGILFHEIGHATAVVVQGGTIDSFSWNYVNATMYQPNAKEKAGTMALGGYIAQTIASETILQNKDWHKSDFALGWMLMGIYVNISNPVRYYIFGETDNDLGVYARTGGNPVIPALFMVAYSGFSLYRIFNDTDIPLYITNDMIGLSMKF